jgi:malonate transporter and related proteins
MTDVLALIAPIFVLIGIGFAVARLGFISEQLVPALGSFVLNFALPALILTALLRQDLRQTINWSYLLAYAGGSLIVFGAILLFMRFALRKPLHHAAIAALGGCASNSGFVGFPVASLALGAPALTALPLSMLVENILVIPLALALAEMGLQEGQTSGKVVSNTLKRLARTPLIQAIFIGIVLSASGLSLPGPISTALDMLASASVSCALFVVGGTLATLRAGSLTADVPLIVAGKLILHPLAVGGAFMLIGGVSPELMAAGIILASSPMLTIYPILGARFDYDRIGASALLAATAISFVTLFVVLGQILPVSP